jgi:hypothetical protein
MNSEAMAWVLEDGLNCGGSSWVPGEARDRGARTSILGRA